jgi:hypothetical protein
MRALIHLTGVCLASILLYGLAFGFVLDRPLSLGFLQQQLDAKLARAATLDGRKLVILAGSNGPYSHRCEVIEPIVAMPCVNGGVAVGIGLDYLFVRWDAQLRPGDVVYLPMEEAQYTSRQTTAGLGPDAAIMFRHDWRTLMLLPPQRWLAAMFSFDMRSALMGPMEIALLDAHFNDPRAAATGATNAWGDHVGHTQDLAATSQAVLAAVIPPHASAAQIRTGYGSALIAGFTRHATARGVRVIGGLPTEFADASIPDATAKAMRAVYLANSGEFIELPNRSRYPRTAFFDTTEHLSEAWQIVHSRMLARLLRRCIAVDADITAADAPRARQ